MGSCCSNSDSNVIVNSKASYILIYQKEISQFLENYSFDSTNKNEFINKICKENNINQDVAEIWLRIYLNYMIILGFNYSKSNNRSVQNCKEQEDIFKFLSIPFEIIQVWRLHVLYTNKYEELCKIVSNNAINHIPFLPPKLIWKSMEPEKLNTYFRNNHSLISSVFKESKTNIDSLFVFQSTYLKNTVNFCLDANSNDISKVINAYNIEFNKEDGIFRTDSRDIKSLKQLSANIENMIFRTIIPNDPVKNYEWNMTNNVEGFALQKSITFQNLKLPTNFVVNFGIDHLLSLDKATEYVNEYKKFMYLTFILKQSLCPSEQVDLVWHFHQLYTKEYREFSQFYFNCNVLGHNPSDGSENDSRIYIAQYNLVIDNILKFFGSLNADCWPNSEIRFSQLYRWYNHHMFMSNTKLWLEGKIVYTNTLNNNNNLFLGCYIG